MRAMSDERDEDLEAFLDWFQAEIAEEPLRPELREAYRKALHALGPWIDEPKFP
jgi:hypothetical protein